MYKRNSGIAQWGRIEFAIVSTWVLIPVMAGSHCEVQYQY